MIEMDSGYEPEGTERREVYGITFEQNRNTAFINENNADEYHNSE